MIAKEESPRTYYDKIDDVYYMHYKDMAEDSVKVLNNEAEVVTDKFGSDDVIISKNDLRHMLKKYNYFKK